MKRIISLLITFHAIIPAYGLVINEIMSNPTGDDGGREWIEVYNDSESSVDLAPLTISIKGGTFIPITQVSGGTEIPTHGYAVIGSTVSGGTRFTQDYGSYGGPLFKSSISLVNTGVTSVEIKLNGSSVDSIPSYTAAKEGYTYSRNGNSYAVGTPSPGEENKFPTQSSQEEVTTTPQTGTQTTIAQMSSPSADITLYLPKEKVVVAGAPTLFSVYSLSHDGKRIDNVLYTWSFGDGGERTGSTTTYRYFYPGRYIAQVEGTNGLIAGTARMIIKVVSPDISVSSIGSGKYGTYIDITNPSNYDLDLSLWKISIDGALFSFPRNTLLQNGVTHFSGISMGFASTTISSSTLVKLLFPNMDEVLRFVQGGVDQVKINHSEQPASSILKNNSRQIKNLVPQLSLQKVSTSSVVITKQTEKDVRLATWIKSFFR